MWSKVRLFAFSCLLASVVSAQVTPLVFKREDIRIVASTPIVTKTKEGAEPEEKPSDPAHAPLSFNVEVRSEDALRLEYIHTLNSLEETSGVIIAFNEPNNYNLPAFRVPTPVDVLFILENGAVEQIIPNVVLSDLTQEITARKPFKGFLFLKAGTVAAKHIQPKDIVSASVFNAAPSLLR